MVMRPYVSVVLSMAMLLLASCWAADFDISSGVPFTDTFVKVTEYDYVQQWWSMTVAPGVAAVVSKVTMLNNNTFAKEYSLDNTLGTASLTVHENEYYMPCESMYLWAAGQQASFTLSVASITPAQASVAVSYERLLSTPLDITYWNETANAEAYVSSADSLITPYIIDLGQSHGSQSEFDDDGAYKVSFELYINPDNNLNGQTLLIASAVGARCPLTNPVFNWTTTHNESFWDAEEEGFGPGVWFVYLVSSASNLIDASFNESLTATADKNWKQAKCDTDDDNMCDRRIYGMSVIVASVVCSVAGVIILLIIAVLIALGVFAIVKCTKKGDESSQLLIEK